MNHFLTIVSLICFSYATFSSAAIHTYMDEEFEKGKIQGISLILFQISPKELSEIPI